MTRPTPPTAARVSEGLAKGEAVGEGSVLGSVCLMISVTISALTVGLASVDLSACTVAAPDVEATCRFANCRASRLEPVVVAVLKVPEAGLLLDRMLNRSVVAGRNPSRLLSSNAPPNCSVPLAETRSWLLGPAIWISSVEPEPSVRLPSTLMAPGEKPGATTALLTFTLPTRVPVPSRRPPLNAKPSPAASVALGPPALLSLVVPLLWLNVPVTWVEPEATLKAPEFTTEASVLAPLASTVPLLVSVPTCRVLPFNSRLPLLVRVPTVRLAPSTLSRDALESDVRSSADRS